MLRWARHYRMAA